MCEIGTSRRSVYQMRTSREQALGEGNCVRVTERGKEACECMGTRFYPRLCASFDVDLGFNVNKQNPVTVMNADTIIQNAVSRVN